MQERIIQAADQLFARFGYSKTTADEISRQAGMSKRTLYKYFESKLKILEALIDSKLNSLEKELNAVLSLQEDFPEKLRRITTSVAVALSTLTGHLLDDMQRNAPAIWEKISAFRKEMVQVYFPMLLDEGIKAGHFKENINKGVAVMLMVNAMEIIINPLNVRSLPPELSREVPDRPEELFDKVIEVIYDGIHQGSSIFGK